MSNTIEVRYLPGQAQYRADFLKGAKLFESKMLTNDEAEAIDMVFGLPGAREHIVLQADYLTEVLGEYADMDESNLMLILQDLAR